MLSDSQATGLAPARSLSREIATSWQPGAAAAARLRFELDRAGGRRQRFGAVEHRGAAEPADAAAGAAGGGDSVYAAADRVSLPAAGAGHADGAQQPDADRACRWC